MKREAKRGKQQTAGGVRGARNENMSRNKIGYRIRAKREPLPVRRENKEKGTVICVCTVHPLRGPGWTRPERRASVRTCQISKSRLSTLTDPAMRLRVLICQEERAVCPRLLLPIHPLCFYFLSSTRNSLSFATMVLAALVAAALGPQLAALIPSGAAAMTVIKAASWAGGRCTKGPVAQSTNATWLGRMRSEIWCLPSAEREPLGFATMVAGEVLAGAAMADAHVRAAYTASSLAYWALGGSVRRWWFPRPADHGDSTSGTAQQWQEVRQQLCQVQRQLLPGLLAEPPTFFEYLGLDATQPPFAPPEECALPASANHGAALKAIRGTYIQRAQTISKQPRELRLLNAITECLLNDTTRHVYLVVFLPALAGGPGLSVGVDNARGRRAVMDSICGK